MRAEVMFYLQQFSMKSAANERCLEPFLNMHKKYNQLYVYICHELFSRLFSSQFQQYTLILFWEKKKTKQNILLNVFFL